MVSAPVDVGKPRPLHLWAVAGDQPLTEHEALEPFSADDTLGNVVPLYFRED